MTHKGNISRLLEIAAPECVCITAVAMVHACNFESLEEIALAKAEILHHPKTKLAILNREISNFDELMKLGSCEKVSFAFKNPLATYEIISEKKGPGPCDPAILNLQSCYRERRVRVQSIESQDRRGLAPFFFRCKEEIIQLGEFPLTGKHNRSNFLAAIACARYFGLSWREISSGMQKLKLPELRGQLIEKEGVLFINDAYNAAPISVKAALENLPSGTSGRKIAVLADMLELGKFSEELHREIGNYAMNFVDTLFCCGQEARYIDASWKKVKREAHWFSNRQELAYALKKYLKSGDVVLIKGSRGTEISKIIDDMETSQK